MAEPAEPDDETPVYSPMATGEVAKDDQAEQPQVVGPGDEGATSADHLLTLSRSRAALLRYFVENGDLPETVEDAVGAGCQAADELMLGFSTHSWPFAMKQFGAENHLDSLRFRPGPTSIPEPQEQPSWGSREERNALIAFESRTRTPSLEEMSPRFGLSKERCRQIIRETICGEETEWGRRARAMVRWTCAACERTEMRRKEDTAPTYCNRDCALRANAFGGGKIPREEIVAALGDFAHREGHLPNSREAIEDPRLPSHSVIYETICGGRSWSAGMAEVAEELGLPVEYVPAVRKNTARRYDSTAVEALLLSHYQETGDLPTYMAVAEDPSLPSATTIGRYLSGPTSWTEAMAGIAKKHGLRSERYHPEGTRRLHDLTESTAGVLALLIWLLRRDGELPPENRLRAEGLPPAGVIASTLGVADWEGAVARASQANGLNQGLTGSRTGLVNAESVTAALVAWHTAHGRLPTSTEAVAAEGLPSPATILRHLNESAWATGMKRFARSAGLMCPTYNRGRGRPAIPRHAITRGLTRFYVLHGDFPTTGEARDCDYLPSLAVIRQKVFHGAGWTEGMRVFADSQKLWSRRYSASTGPKYNAGEVDARMAVYFEVHGELPTYAEALRDPALPSPNTIIRHRGSPWATAMGGYTRELRAPDSRYCEDRGRRRETTSSSN